MKVGDYAQLADELDQWAGRLADKAGLSEQWLSGARAVVTEIRRRDHELETNLADARNQGQGGPC